MFFKGLFILFAVLCFSQARPQEELETENEDGFAALSFEVGKFFNMALDYIEGAIAEIDKILASWNISADTPCSTEKNSTESTPPEVKSVDNSLMKEELATQKLEEENELFGNIPKESIHEFNWPVKDTQAEEFEAPPLMKE